MGHYSTGGHLSWKHLLGLQLPPLRKKFIFTLSLVLFQPTLKCSDISLWPNVWIDSCLGADYPGRHLSRGAKCPGKDKCLDSKLSEVLAERHHNIVR